MQLHLLLVSAFLRYPTSWLVGGALSGLDPVHRRYTFPAHNAVKKLSRWHLQYVSEQHKLRHRHRALPSLDSCDRVSVNVHGSGELMLR